MFSSVSNLTVDDRGRITIPKKYTALFNIVVNSNNDSIKSITDASKNLNDEDCQIIKKLVVTKHLYKPCLNVYTVSEWQKIIDKINSLPPFAETTESLQFIFGTNAEPLELDKNNRILISKTLREEVNLGANPVLAGLTNRFQLWNEQEFQKAKAQNEEKAKSAEFRQALENL